MSTDTYPRLPDRFCSKVTSYPECSYGAVRVTLVLRGGRRIHDVIIGGDAICKIGPTRITSESDLDFSVSDIEDVKRGLGTSVTESRQRLIAVIGLVIGAVLGMAGTFVPSASLRGLFWGLDGIALIVAATLLTIHHFRRGNDIVAAGFLVFVVGETLILSGAAMDLAASGPVFAAGTGLWAASLALVSVPNVMPSWVRVVAAVAALLFAVVAVQVFMGAALTPLSQPLPFFAYPFLAVTLFGWAWVHFRNTA